MPFTTRGRGGLHRSDSHSCVQVIVGIISQCDEQHKARSSCARSPGLSRLVNRLQGLCGAARGYSSGLTDWILRGQDKVALLFERCPKDTLRAGTIH
jgi:hypothetical protein